MAKPRTLFKCQECGYAEPKWLGQCPGCGQWNTMVEESERDEEFLKASPPRSLTEFSSEVVRLSEMSSRPEARTPTGVGELDRILGGGLVSGQVVLLAGPPGIGKSTLMMQVASSITGCVLYVSGEESLAQVSGRARRLGVDSKNIYLVSETNIARILETLQKVNPGLLVLDSVQTVFHPEMSGSPGSVGQVRECAAELLRAAKSRGVVLFLLGHVTKEGTLAGPKVLEHLVDTVLYFDAEKHHLLRVLRAYKNRFGPTSEIAIFEMRERGLVEIKNASEFFVQSREGGPPCGRAVGVALEGSRPILTEVQALVTPTRYPLPRRVVTGLDLNRVMMLMAALEKHLRLSLENRDVFVSLAGGIRLRDPGLDLAVCAAIVTSLRETPVGEDWVFVGEVGLLGDVERVGAIGLRLKEAERAGFENALVARQILKDLPELGLSSLKVNGARRLNDVSDVLKNRDTSGAVPGTRNRRE